MPRLLPRLPPFSGYHQEHDGEKLQERHPDTAFDPELASREERRAGASLDEERLAGFVAADLVSEDGAGHEIPCEMESDGKPEAPVELPRQAEEHPAQEDVEEADVGDGSVAGVERRKYESNQEECKRPVPAVQVRSRARVP